MKTFLKILFYPLYLLIMLLILVLGLILCIFVDKGEYMGKNSKSREFVKEIASLIFY